MLFSKEVLELYEQICGTADLTEKTELMIELAELFISDTTDTDHHLGEDVHDLIAAFIESRMAFERKAMALSRVLMRSLPSYASEHSDLEEDSQAN